MARKIEKKTTERKGKWWRLPLVRELIVILAIKLAVIMVIKSLFFSQPAPVNPDHLVAPLNTNNSCAGQVSCPSTADKS